MNWQEVNWQEFLRLLDAIGHLYLYACVGYLMWKAK